MSDQRVMSERSCGYNTIPLPEEKQIDKIKVPSVAPLLGEALVRPSDASKRIIQLICRCQALVLHLF